MDSNVTTRAHLETAVLDAMDAASAEVMQWGVDDCSLWVANALRAATGHDFGAWFRGRYHSRFGAAKLIAAQGGMDRLLRGVARRNGWKPVASMLAQPGDVGLTWTPTGLAMCICRSRGWFVARNERGFTMLPASMVPVVYSVLDDAWQPLTVAPMCAGRMMPQPVHEPVSLAILSTLAIEATATSIAITTFIVSTALSVGFSLVASMLQPQNGYGDTSNFGSNTQSSAQITERQSLPYKRVIVGNAVVGGALFFEQVKAPYLTMGMLVNYGRISGINSVKIGTNPVTFGTISENTVLTPLPFSGDVDYSSNLQMCVRYGADDQTRDALIHANYASVDSNFRQQGIATATFRYKYPAAGADAFYALWGQVARPNAYLDVSGAFVYDPRDPTQSLSDELTWKWSNNASLIIAWYLTRSFGGRVSVDDVDWQKVGEAASYDDQVVGCKDGTLLKRHTADGVIVLNQKPYEVMPKLLSANRSYLIRNAGKWWVQSAAPQTPLFTITDKIIAGPFSYQAAKAKRDKINKLQVRFVATEQEDQLVDGPILNRADLQTTDQEELPGTLTLEFTKDHRRAQRLQKAYLQSSRLGRTITVPVDINLLATVNDEIIGRVGNFQSELAPSANGTYLATGVGFADDMSTLSLALTEYDATIETDWVPADDEQDFVLADINVS